MLYFDVDMVISPEEVKEAIRKLDDNKSCDLDTITAEHLKFASISGFLIHGILPDSPPPPHTHTHTHTLGTEGPHSCSQNLRLRGTFLPNTVRLVIHNKKNRPVLTLNTGLRERGGGGVHSKGGSCIRVP